jgi:DNA modification methylase
MGISSTLSVVYRELSSLRPYQGNARRHSKRQLRQIAESIRSFGFANPILVDTNGMIVAGHGRAEAAKLIGMAEVPTVTLEGLTEDQIRAYVLADNRLAERAKWDHDTLAIELQHLATVDLGFDLTVTGFEIAEIDLAIGTAPAQDLEDELEPEDVGVPVTQPGDLWLLGKHRVLCGNALDAACYETLMNGQQAAMVFVDPPYNVVIDGNVSGKGVVKHADFAMASGEMSRAEFTAFLKGSFEQLALHSESGSVHFACMDFRHMREILDAGEAVYNTLLNLCVWAKNKGGQGSFYRSRHELVFIFRNGAEQHRNNIQLGKYGRYRTNVWDYPAPHGFAQERGEEENVRAHPTMKPVAMIADAVLDCSAPEELVLDCFLGSGSTVMACERTGRTCYGMELSPQYVDTTIRRWQRLTGGEAVHAVTGKHFNDAVGGEAAHG